MQFDELIAVMRRLALEAGDRIMQIYDGPDFEVRAKSDDSPVTEADEAADALISAGLRATFPEVALVTEEQAATHGQTLSTFLIVDPRAGVASPTVPRARVARRYVDATRIRELRYDAATHRLDADVAARMEEVFALDSGNCTELTLDEWTRRPLIARVTEGILSPWRPLL